MKIIENVVVTVIEISNDSKRNSYSHAKNINKGIKLVGEQIPDGDFNEVFKHPDLR